MLVDTTKRDMTTELFGHRIDAPICFAPVGVNKVGDCTCIHPSRQLICVVWVDLSSGMSQLARPAWPVLTVLVSPFINTSSVVYCCRFFVSSSLLIDPLHSPLNGYA